MHKCGFEELRFLWKTTRRIRGRIDESAALAGMTNSDRGTYQLYCSMTGQGETFKTAESAAAAWHVAKAEDRPCVIYGHDRAAQVLVRTLTIGDQVVKAMPGESEPRFCAAYHALTTRSPAP